MSNAHNTIKTIHVGHEHHSSQAVSLPYHIWDIMSVEYPDLEYGANISSYYSFLYILL